MMIPSNTNATPTDNTMIIGIFCFKNALFTSPPLLVWDEPVVGCRSDILSTMGAGVEDAAAPVWLSLTFTNSAWAAAGFVTDSNCTYGSAVVSTLPSTKSPKLIRRYTFRTGGKLEDIDVIDHSGIHRTYGKKSRESCRNMGTRQRRWVGTGMGSLDGACKSHRMDILHRGKPGHLDSLMHHRNSCQAGAQDTFDHQT
jgi:hypothetical protein